MPLDLQLQTQQCQHEVDLELTINRFSPDGVFMHYKGTIYI